MRKIRLMTRVVKVEACFHAAHAAFEFVHAIGQVGHVRVNQAEARIN